MDINDNTLMVPESLKLLVNDNSKNKLHDYSFINSESSLIFHKYVHEYLHLICIGIMVLKSQYANTYLQSLEVASNYNIMLQSVSITCLCNIDSITNTKQEYS